MRDLQALGDHKAAGTLAALREHSIRKPHAVIPHVWETGVTDPPEHARRAAISTMRAGLTNPISLHACVSKRLSDADMVIIPLLL